VCGVAVRGFWWGMEVESRAIHAARSDCTFLLRRLELSRAYHTTPTNLEWSSKLHAAHTSLPPTTLRFAHDSLNSDV